MTEDNDVESDSSDNIDFTWAPSTEYNFSIDFQNLPEGVLRALNQLGHAVADLMESIPLEEEDESE